MADVRLEDLRKRLGGHEVLAGLTLQIRDGELFTVVGPSGCGKSTLLNLIAGLDRPTGGRILFDGLDVTEMEPRERDVALVFQSYALYPHMTVAENLAFPLRVGRPQPGRPAIAEAVRRTAGLLGLEALLARRPRELSGGQRQRVALGRALIRNPRVFLLDEPLSNLDAQLRAGMRAELRRIHEQSGTTMIYVTHDQIEALTLADRLAVLHEGRLQQIGTPQDLYERPANAFVAGFVGYPGMNLIPARIELGCIVSGPLRLPCPADLAATEAGGAVVLGLRPETLRVSARSRSATVTTGIVRLIEPMGGQTWITLDADHPDGQHQLVGRGDEEFPVKPGERASVSVMEPALHLFDAETGARLHHRPVPEPRIRRSS